MDRSTPIETAEAIVARERLRLLALAHYIYGGMGLLVLPFFIPFFAMMLMFATIPQQQSQKPAQPAPLLDNSGAYPRPASSPQPKTEPPPAIVFAVFAAVAGTVFLGIVTCSAVTAYAGWCIHQRKKRTLIYIVSGFNCLFVPYGTILGVSTILVLGSPEARAEFPTAGG
jgi:Mn2+/Fe2+ NRAMP family transporter